MRTRKWLAATLLAVAVPPAAAGGSQEAPGAREQTLTLHLRTYYLDRERPVPPDSKAFAAGGWIGYDSGWFFDRFKVALTGYTSQKLVGPPDQDGTLLLKPGQKSYSVLGEAYASVKLWDDHKFSAYRQLIVQPEVNPQDNRMTPNTFEAYNFMGKAGGFGYFAGYVDKMKTRNSDKFLDMANVAGAPPGVSSAMWLGGLSYVPMKDFALRLSSYHVSDILNSTYLDADWTTPLSPSWKLQLTGQYMFQGSTGRNALTGADFDTWSAGLRAALTNGAATMRATYTQTGSGANYRSPYGTWAGFTSLVVSDFNRASERAFGLEGSYDFKKNLPGFAATAYAVFGSKAINPATGARVSDKDEYNVTLDYRFGGSSYPDWLKPLWLRGRVTRIDESLNGSTSHTWDYRFIVNYEYVLKF
jgi:hypothetical protein